MPKAKSGENLPLVYRPQTLTLTPVEKIIIQHNGVAFFGVRDVLNILMNNDGVYYLTWTDEVRSLVAVSCCISEGCVSEIVGEMIRRNYYDQKVFAKYRVLTNLKVQNDLLRADRKKVCLIQEFLSSSLTIPKPEKVEIWSLSRGRITQRKEKKSSTFNHITNLNCTTSNIEEEEGQFVPISLFQEMLNKFKTAFPNRYIADTQYFYDTVDMDLLIEKMQNSSFLRGNNWSLKSCLKNYDKIIAGNYDDYKKAQKAVTASDKPKTYVRSE